MFTWTPQAVLAAIDAGIAEVIKLFNANHTLAHLKGVPAGQSAYTFAMVNTVADLNTREVERLMVAAVDAVLAITPLTVPAPKPVQPVVYSALPY